MQNIILIVGLIIISILWLYTDPRPFKKRFSENVLYAYLLLLIVILPQLLSYYYFQIPYFPFNYLLQILGIILFILGLLIDIWARFTMGKFWGPPGQHNSKRQTKLITDGPFRYSRNPIYIGTFLLLIGLSLSLKSILFWLPIIQFLYFNKQIRKEEKLLESTFGKTYISYKSKVPRYL